MPLHPRSIVSTLEQLRAELLADLAAIDRLVARHTREARGAAAQRLPRVLGTARQLRALAHNGDAPLKKKALTRFVLQAVRDQPLTAAAIGQRLAAAGHGFKNGSALSGPIAKWIGVGYLRHTRNGGYVCTAKGRRQLQALGEAAPPEREAVSAAADEGNE